MPEVHSTLARMEQLVEAIHRGQHRGHTGKRLTDVVSIGIGGSFLGPKLVVEALKPYWQGGLNCHFVANIDGTDISETLKALDPETTLFLVQSKSFRTQETLDNSLVARQWFLANGGSDTAIASHFMAVVGHRPAHRADAGHGTLPFPAGRRPFHGLPFPQHPGRT